jgi:hypothetical protein
VATPVAAPILAHDRQARRVLDRKREGYDAAVRAASLYRELGDEQRWFEH